VLYGMLHRREEELSAVDAVLPVDEGRDSLDEHFIKGLLGLPNCDLVEAAAYHGHALC